MATDRRYPFSTAGRPPPRTAELLFGLGLGGFVDGIVLHQILQWHHMVSSVDGAPTDPVLGLELNTLADGFFHLATWVLVVAAAVTSHAEEPGRAAPSAGLRYLWRPGRYLAHPAAEIDDEVVRWREEAAEPAG